MSGARTDAYREIWCELYGHVEPEGDVTIERVVRRFAGRISYITVRRALRRAEEVGLIERAGGAKSAATALQWKRARLPDLLTFEWMKRHGGADMVCVNILKALESGGYLKFTGKGYAAAD